MSYLARRAFASTTSAAAAATSGIARQQLQQRAAFSVSARREIAKITLVGNLGGTPEVKPTPSGREVIEYTVASNEGSGENRRTSWFRVSAFETAEARRDFLTSLPKGYVVPHYLPLFFFCFFLGDLFLRCSVGGRVRGRGAH